ncbi:MAG: hypothetical protein Q9207_004858 [Kuettlingeria erythrocarpa]
MREKNIKKNRSQRRVPEPFRMPLFKSLDLYEITVEEVQRYMASGRISSLDYVTYCLERIRLVNPYLEAVIETNPDALAIAKSLDDERHAGGVRSPLHGIPVLVKDNIATHDKMQTTAGSWALLGSKVPKDAHIISRLRDAGAVVIGHTNMSEWAAVRSSDYSPGYSPRGGQCRNAFDLSKSPCMPVSLCEKGAWLTSAIPSWVKFWLGRSSFRKYRQPQVPISIGTETDTSIIGPADVNGVVGIKPTVGLTSRAGVIPISRNMDSVGVFGRTVADAVHALEIIAGKDEEDPMTPDRVNGVTAYSESLVSRSALKGARFGLPWSRCWDSVAPQRKDVALRIFRAIENAGAEIIGTDFPCAEDRIAGDGNWDWKRGEPHESEFMVVKTDAYSDINAYLSQLSESPVRLVEDVIAFNIRNGGTEGAQPGDVPAFHSGQDDLHEVVKSRGAEDQTYLKALHYTRHKCRVEGIDAALKFNDSSAGTVEVDALLLCDRKGAGQQLAAQAGYPIITIPIGLDTNGFPVSLSFHQRAWQEGKLIKWASAVEDLVHEVQGWRPTPEYRNFHSKNVPVVSLP